MTSSYAYNDPSIEELEADEEFEMEPVGDMAAAERAMAKVKYYERRKAEVKATHAAEMERLDEWAAEETRKLDGAKSWHENALTGWHRAVYESDDKRKTISVPSGTLVTRAGLVRVEIIDAAAFLTDAPDELVKITKTPKKDEIKKYIKATGEVLPGVVLETGERTFEVKPS